MAQPPATIILHPAVSEGMLLRRDEERRQIEKCLDDIDAIIDLLFCAVEGERNLAGRAYLNDQLAAHSAALRSIMLPEA